MQESKSLTRAFIAIEMPSEIVREVTRVQEVLGKKRFQGKMTEPENLHLTLKFLGEIDEKKAEEVREEMRKIKSREFEARLGETGIFSLRGMPRIVWAKIGGKGIFELQKQIDNAMEKIGFVKEERFMSHMTIARIKYVRDKKDFAEYARKISFREIKWKVREFSLKKSELLHKGPVYTD